MTLTLGIAVLAGLVSFLSPCVFPLVPAYIGYMSGRVTRTVSVQTAGGPAVQIPIAMRINTLMHGMSFVLGFTLVFVVFGLATTAFLFQIGGQNIALFRDIIGRAGGLLIIFFGLQFSGLLGIAITRVQARGWTGSTLFTGVMLALLIGLSLWAMVDILFAIPLIAVVLVWFVLGNAFQAPEAFWTRAFTRLQRGLYADTRRQMDAANGRPAGLFSSMLMGIIFAAGWTPCIGPIYGSILTLAANGSDIGQAAGLMVAYSLGLGIPFLIAALALDGAQGFLRRMRKALPTIERVAGIFMIAVGILVASGQLQLLSQNAAVQFADLSYRLEECAVQLSNGTINLGEFPACVNGDVSASAGA